MKDTEPKADCWVVTEGISGTENQCIGIAQALGINYETRRITLNEPWLSLSPYLGFECRHSFEPKITLPFPNLVISSGRKAIAAARYIKRKSKGKTIVVHIQDPRISLNNFDLIAVPEHDPLRGANVIVTKCTPNKITIPQILKAKENFPDLKKLKSPRVAVLIGGSSKAYKMTQDITKKLAQNLNDIDGALMITCSRRTGIENQKILNKHLNDGNNFFWDGSGENPYMAILGWADYILVTADSASMISESATTGKPVYLIELEGGTKRIKKMHENLMHHGALRKFEGKLESFTYEPLNDAQIVANEIKKRFGALLNIPDN